MKSSIFLKITFIVLSLLFSSDIYSIGDTIIISFSNHRGFYDNPFLLSVESTDSTATIKYTTDCSDPLSTSGNDYNAPLSIATTTIVKTIAYTKTDTSELITQTFLFPEKILQQPSNPTGFPSTWGGSKIISADYEMDPNVINAPEYSSDIIGALKSLPSISLTMDVDEWFNPETGLYVGYPNTNITREKPVIAEFIYEDSVKNFLVNCGVQNQGGTSIVNWKVPKQSMRLLFKSQYGPKKLKKEIFPDSDINSINTLVIDGFLYSWIHPWDNTQRNTSLYFRDQLASNIQNNMGGVSFHGVYVNLYINGLYWGVYDLHERPDEDFMAEYYNAETEDFDVIKHNPSNVVAGSNETYLTLLNQARKGFSTNESLESIKDHLDIPAFIDYMILNFFLGNYDWAHQNFYAAVNKTLNTGYRFYTWDAEHVMRYSDVNYNNTDKNDSGGPTEIHQLLKQNSEYRIMFADAFYKHAFNDGALTSENFENAFLKLKNEIDLAIILESARWGDYLESSTGKTYTKNNYWIPEINKVLDNYIPYRLSKVLEQFRQSNNLLFPMVMPPIFNKDQGKINRGESVTLNNNNNPSGDIYYTLDGTDPRKVGGEIQGIKYTSPIIIDETVQIKARFRASDSQEWSALTKRQFITDTDYNAIIISEIMYNFGYNNIEFIELQNNGPNTIDLLDYSFVDGIDYSFEHNLSLEPGNKIVLANDSNLFYETYGFAPYDCYSKKLNNGGETLLVANMIGEIIDSVSYLDSIPWPIEADGYGYSLELIDANSDNANASNWKSSEKLFGNPEEYTPVSIFSEVSNTPTLNIYPNPFNDGIYLNITNTNSANNITFEVYNNLGQRIKTVYMTETSLPLYIDLTDLDTGIYILKALDKNSKVLFVNKIIKLR